MKFNATRGMVVLAVAVLAVASTGSFSSISISDPTSIIDGLTKPVKFLIGVIISALLYMGFVGNFFSKK